jgi:WD40-like Beta Propeller Repeat
MRELSTREMGRRLCFAVIGAAALALVLPAASGAALPGTNGRIAFEKGAETGPSEFEVQVWSMNPDGSGATQLTSGGDAVEGAYSPDGSLLAFDRYNEVWVAAADGSNARAIAVGSEQNTTVTRWVANYEDPETSTVYPWVKIDEHREDRDFRSEPAFSPDGKALAVSHYSGTFVIEFICSVNANNDASCNGTYSDVETHCDGCGANIEAIDPGTGSLLATLVPREPGVYLRAPAYSSAGALAYTRELEGDFENLEIRVVPAPGAASVLLVKGQVREPDFSPDGSRLAFNSGRHDIGIVAATGGTPTFVTAPPPEPGNEVWFTRNPVWSPDGSLIAFGNAGGAGGFGLLTDGGVYLMHPDGSNISQIQGDATTPSSWQPIPIPPPPPTPPVRAPAIKGKKKVRLNKKGIATVATIVCGSSPCSLKAAKSKLKVGKKAYAIKTLNAKSLPPGANTPLKIKVKGKALAALKKKHRGRLALTLAVTDATGTQSFIYRPRVLPARTKHHKKKR